MISNTRNIAFIINPKSGTNRAKDLNSTIENIFANTNINYVIAYTTHAGHATKLAQLYADLKYETVVAVGGDGTVNEVAQGLINSNTALGIVPLGSGNGLARACNISLKPAIAITAIKKGYIKLIDVGYINNKLFLSNAGTGFDAYIAKQCANQNKRGLMMYARTSIQHFSSYKSKTYKITIDGEKTIEEKAMMISIANGKEFGYGFKIAPNASCFDGKLDIVIVKPLNFFNAPRVGFMSWWGNVTEYSKVNHYVGKKITITCDNMNLYQIDGDYHDGTTNLEIRIEPKALNIIVP